MILKSAKVLSDGLVVRLQFEAGVSAGEAALDRLNDCGFFDYLAPKNAGVVATVNGSAAEVIGLQVEDWNMLLPWLEPPGTSGSIAASTYTFLLAIADASGNEIYTGPPIWAYSNETGVTVLANGSIQFGWRQAVQPGQTLRIYAATTSPNASNMNLVASVPYASLTTPTSYTLTSMSTPGATWTRKSVCLNVTLLLPSPIVSGANVLITAPAGLVTDGTHAAPAINTAAVNESVVGADGFLNVGAMSFAQTVYISNSHGSDTTGDGSINNPYKTKSKADSVIPSTTLNVRFCFLRGDTFPFDPWTIAHWGSGLTTPTLYESYWNPAYGADPGTRPVIMDSPDNNANNILFQQGQSGRAYYGAWPYQYFRGLEIRRDPTLKASGNVWPTNTPSDYTIFSDCLFNNICLVPFGSAQHIATSGCAFHRCVIAGAIGGSGVNDPHVQGMFIGHCGDWLFSQTAFYHNGWRSADGSANDQFNHNLYLSAMSRNVIFHSGWSVDGCLSGIQMRGGGVCAYSIFSGNPSHLSSNDGHTFYKNVCLNNGLYNHIASGTHSFGPVAIHDFNLSIGNTGIDQTRTVVNNYDGLYCFTHDSTGPYVYSAIALRYETAVDSGGISIGNWQPSKNLIVDHNLIINRLNTGIDPAGNGLRSVNLATGTGHTFDASKIVWNYNGYQVSKSSTAFKFPDITTPSFGTWQTYGRDAAGTLLTADPVFPTPPTSGFVASAITALLTRKDSVWLSSHSGKTAYQTYATAYTTSQVAATTDNSHFGAVDYTGLTIPASRDDLVIVDDMGNRLQATGLFSEIVTGAAPDELEVSGDRVSVVWIDRIGWTEQPAAAEYLTERTVVYDLYLAYRHADINVCWRYLNQLESVILNTLNRVSYNNTTFPSFSMINRGEDQKAKDGEQRIKMRGMFRYQFVDDRTDHNISLPQF